MECFFCKVEIMHYNHEFNQFIINEFNKVNLCQTCIDKFNKWQQKKFAKILPTKTLKKMYPDNEK
jgi:hypothetical protein